MHRIFSSLVLLFLLSLGLVALIWFNLSTTQNIKTMGSLSHKDVALARQIIANNDPQQLKSGSQRTLVLAEKDLNLVANYLLNSISTGGVQVELAPGKLHLQASIKLPENPFKPYLNLTLTIQENNGKANITDLHIGQISLPGRLADLILAEVSSNVFPSEGQRLFRDVIKKLSLSSGKLQITYEWNPKLIYKVQSSLISPQNHDRILDYYRKLADITNQPGLGKRPSALLLMKPLFTYAQSRSKGGNPMAENRAVLIVLAAYAAPGKYSAMMPKISDLTILRQLTITLDRRKDFAEHFLLSAAIAATGDAVLARAVGLYKEIADSKGNSGFSFSDLAADRAGARFGATATTSLAGAYRVQELFAGNVNERDFMPKARDLPEHMGEQEFNQRFGGIGGAGYRELEKQIEQRIVACRLYGGGGE